MKGPPRRIFVLLACLPAALSGACSTPFDAREMLAARLREREPGTRAWLQLGAAGAQGFRIEIPMAALPAAARRCSEDFVQPGGELLLSAREHSSAGQGFRIIKRYPHHGRRSLLLDEAGRVLERSHQIPLDELPAPVRSAAGPGQLLSAESLVGTPGEGTRYLLVLQDQDGGRQEQLFDALGKRLQDFAWLRHPPGSRHDSQR